MTQTNWTAKVPILFDQNNLGRHIPSSALKFVSQVVLIHAGLTSLIAHIRVGLMQVALEAKSAVQPAIGRFSGFMSTSALRQGSTTTASCALNQGHRGSCVETTE